MSTTEIQDYIDQLGMRSLSLRPQHFPFGAQPFLRGMANVFNLYGEVDLQFEIPIHHNNEEALRNTWLIVGGYLRRAIGAFEQPHVRTESEHSTTEPTA